MAGLQLRTTVSAGAGYTPMTPAAAGAPSRTSIAEKAYGISGTGVSGGSNVAAYGSVGIGIAATLALVYLWWSLPR